MLKLFKTNKTEVTKVYLDGIEVTGKEEYPVIDINRHSAVIRNLNKLDPNYAAKIDYNIDDNLRYSCIEKLSVYDPLQRGKHMGRTLLIHVLGKLKDNQMIWVSASASPTPINTDDLDGPCYGLTQEELEIYYKRFTYGRKQRHILFQREMEVLCQRKNKSR